ncbi:MAG: hypothetical protein IPP22_03915 [Nitrosomonas sp.]|nr:hypothetical protein [Nitrosomonas sp.]
MKKTIRTLFLSMLLFGLLSACSTTQKITNSARTATEQLLISEAITRSLPKQIDLPLPMPKGAIVKLDVTGLTPDKDMAKGVVAGWLGFLGYTVQDGPENAAYRVNLVIDSLGSEVGNTFIGIPPVEASLLPIALPELALFKAELQSGYARFHLDVFDMPSGRFIASSSPFIADTFYNAYTVLFLISFNKTDLTSPPQIRTFPKGTK